jgi:hypothetical protein
MRIADLRPIVNPALHTIRLTASGGLWVKNDYYSCSGCAALIAVITVVTMRSQTEPIPWPLVVAFTAICALLGAAFYICAMLTLRLLFSAELRDVCQRSCHLYDKVSDWNDQRLRMEAEEEDGTEYDESIVSGMAAKREELQAALNARDEAATDG